MSVSSPRDQFDAPYPLRRLFRGRALPLFAVIMTAVAVIAGWGGTTLMRSIYLEFATRRAQVIDAALSHEAGAAWKALAVSTDPAAVYATADGQVLLATLRGEQRELGLARLKIYGVDGVLLFATEEQRIGQRDPSAAYRRAATAGERSVVRKDNPADGPLYELYVPLVASGGTARLVFELYEPVGRLDAILLRTGGLAIGLPVLLLVVLALTVNRLVESAQQDIDWRTAKLAELRGRLERLLSRSAAEAAREAVDGEGFVSRALDCTLLYSDIRGFTAFSERHPPAEVVAFLNHAMALQVNAIDEAGGDIDKMIGDAVLARFDGADGQARAVGAAQNILREAQARSLTPGLGIGIYAGAVIAGAVGPPNRQDFTVIGDSVNVAARLCSAAGAGELVMDAKTAVTAGVTGLTESIAAKGKSEPIDAVRWRVVA